MRARCISALLLAAAAACSAPSPTQLVVVVDTDLRIGTEIDAIEVEVRGASGPSQSETSTLQSSSQLPMTMGIAPSGDSLGPITVTAHGLLDTEVVVRRTHRVTLVAGETRVLILHLTAACDVRTATPCADGLTCSENGCVPEAVDGHDLPAWTGRAPALGEDAGAPVRRDGGPDGSVIPDGGGDAGPPPCTGPADCDDGEPCTDDVCGTGGCEHLPNTAACDDGLFCNGADSCREGSCDVHAGLPCPAPTTCEEGTDRCTGCSADAECPVRLESAWSACSYAAACANDGTQSRTVQTFACVDTICVPTSTTEMQPCTRNTNGLVCGAATCPAFGECGTFADTCDPTGMQSRTCSGMLCDAGACVARDVVESIACSRSVAGTPCGSGSCSAWSDCSGWSDACDESGTQMRTCTGAPSCDASGACVPGPSVPETQSCTRDTDGLGCGAAGSCGAWGACGGFSDPCDTTGEERRDCTGGQSCVGGACTGGGDYVDTQACSRGTDGADCGPPSCGAWGPCEGFTDTCDTTGTQSRTCTDPVCTAGGCADMGYMETQSCTRATDGNLCDDGDRCTYDDSCSGGACQPGWSDCVEPCYCTPTGVCRSPGGGFCAVI